MKDGWGKVVLAGLACGFLLMGTGCARPTRTVEQVAGPVAPPDLRVGRNPDGGPSEAPTGAGAGGSAAAGYEAGRVAGHSAGPTVPPPPYGITDSRMSPVSSSGSGLGDRGHPIPPDQPLSPPTDGVSQPISPNPSPLPPNVRS